MENILDDESNRSRHSQHHNSRFFTSHHRSKEHVPSQHSSNAKNIPATIGIAQHGPIEHKQTPSTHELPPRSRSLQQQLQDLQQVILERDYERSERLKAYDRIEHEAECEDQELQRRADDILEQINHTTGRVTELNTPRVPQEQRPASDLAQLADILTDNIMMNRLPLPEPTNFDGNPLSYLQWKTSFDLLIGQRNVNPAEKLFFLQKYTSGAANRCIAGAFYLGTEEAYLSARRRLKHRFGADLTIAEAFRNRLAHVKKIHKNDYVALQDYADLLSQTDMAREAIHGLEILDDRLENQKLAKKLPDGIIHTWARKILQYSEMEGRYPLFSEFVAFVNNESEAHNNPLVSSLFEGNSAHKRCLTTLNAETKREQKELYEEEKPIETSDNMHIMKCWCMLCKKKSHNLTHCRDFSSKTTDAKKEFIRKHRLCFGCLRSGHMSKSCEEKITCEICKYKHPTSIHNIYEERYRSTDSKDNENEVEDHEDEVPAAVMNTTTQNIDVDSYTMAIPVYVSNTNNPENEVLVYTLLDTQSNRTFVLEEVAKKLSVPTKSAKLRLTTMSSTVVEECPQYEDLQVRSMNTSTTIQLPTTFARSKIPGDISQIACQDVAKRY